MASAAPLLVPFILLASHHPPSLLLSPLSIRNRCDRSLCACGAGCKGAATDEPPPPPPYPYSPPSPPCSCPLSLSVTGVTEAFVHAVLDAKGLQQMNMLLIAFSVAHVTASIVCINALGAVGLVVADALNMALRIACSAW